MNWTINKAASEFGLSRETLRKRLNAAEIPKRATYTTKEICRGVFGDIESEKLGLVREQREKLALDNAMTRRETVNAAELRAVVERGLAAMVAAVSSASNLESEDKAKIITHLHECGASVVRSVEGGNSTPNVQGEPVGGTLPVS